MAQYPTHKKEDHTKTERQWNLLGFVVRPGANGVKMWSNPNSHGKPFIYFSEDEVFKDDSASKLIKERSQAQDTERKRFNREKRQALRDYKTALEWLELRRIVLPDAEGMSGDDLNSIYFIKPEKAKRFFTGRLLYDKKVYLVGGGGAYQIMRFFTYSTVESTYYHLDDTRLAENDTELENERKRLESLREFEFEKQHEKYCRLRGLDPDSDE